MTAYEPSLTSFNNGHPPKKYTRYLGIIYCICNASVDSSGAHPPPGQPPGISIVFFKWQIPGGGDK